MLRLRRTLDDKGISMKNCADILGVSEKTMYNKITGESDFTYKESRKIKAILPEYDIDFLLSEDTLSMRTGAGGA